MNEKMVINKSDFFALVERNKSLKAELEEMDNLPLENQRLDEENTYLDDTNAGLQADVGELKDGIRDIMKQLNELLEIGE